ncbi:hypothetical protein BaRGS_00021622 [Batillaria attramentaria]|uniref:Uncharacterized protein n=1 Tax=Batillaria attramentaria TaxID=370345 RepID=A0ABD0KJ69_9CAEN
MRVCLHTTKGLPQTKTHCPLTVLHYAAAEKVSLNPTPRAGWQAAKSITASNRPPESYTASARVAEYINTQLLISASRHQIKRSSKKPLKKLFRCPCAHPSARSPLVLCILRAKRERKNATTPHTHRPSNASGRQRDLPTVDKTQHMNVYKCTRAGPSCQSPYPFQFLASVILSSSVPCLLPASDTDEVRRGRDPGG